MYKIYYSNLADSDLQEIYDYIASDSSYNAGRYLGKMEKQILKLAETPSIGVKPRYQELASLGLLVLVFEKYLIFYKVKQQEKEVEIVRVLSGQRNYIKLFNS